MGSSPARCGAIHLWSTPLSIADQLALFSLAFEVEFAVNSIIAVAHAHRVIFSHCGVPGVLAMMFFQEFFTSPYEVWKQRESIEIAHALVLAVITSS